MKPVEKKAPEATDHTYSYNLDYQFSKKFDNSQLTVGGTYERIHADSKVTGSIVAIMWLPSCNMIISLSIV